MGESQVRLIGDVVVHDDRGERTSRSTLLRTLLALLAVARGRIVPSDVLVDELWGEDLPRDPRAALAIQVTRLRVWLVPDAPRDAPVRSESGGYRLTLPDGHVDVARFDAAAATALALDRPSGARLAAAEAALAEWRDEPFGGAHVSDRLRAEAQRLAERRLLLVETRAELLIDAGEPTRALEGLLPVRAVELGRERLTLLTMRAYQRCGHRPEALAAYRECAAHLREELGLSPGRALRAVQAELLVEEPLRASRPPVAGPSLVGRAEPLARLQGASGLVVVEGPAGIGKSTLLRAALAAARDGGARVAAGAWDDDEAPLAAWQEAFAALDLPAREALTGSVVHARLTALGRSGPVVIGLDDAHRADAASLGVVRALVRRGLPAGVLIVVTGRPPDERSVWDDLRADLATRPEVTRLGLGELADEDVVTLALRRLPNLDPEAARRVGTLVAARSGGHPLHAVALLHVLRELPDEAACRDHVTRVPESVRPLLQRQVTGLPDECRRRIEVLATLRPIALETLAGAVGTSTSALLEDLRPALDAGLLGERTADDRVEFRHDLVADVVREEVPEINARRWHRAALAALSGDADPFERRRHGLAAGPLVGPGALAELHRRAGHAAYRRGAAVQALGYLDEAAGYTVDADIALGRGLALTALGRLDEAHDVLDALLTDLHPTEEQARRAAVGDGTLGAQVTGDARRLARLRRVAARPGSVTLPDRERLELLLALTVEETVLEGRVTSPEAPAELGRLADRLADDPDPDTAVRARLVLFRASAEAPVPVGRRLAEARAVVATAATAADATVRLDAGEALIAALLAHGRVDEARDTAWWVRREARRAARPRSVWAASLLDAALALAAGEVDEADALAARAHALGTEAGVPDAAGTLQAFTMVRHWQTGTAALLGELPAAAARAYPHLPAWTAAAACADVQAGRMADAADQLRRFRERRSALEARTFDRPALCLAATAAFRLGDVETARVVCANLPPDPEAVVVLGIDAAVMGPACFFRGLAEAVLDDRDTALDHLEHAATLAGDIGWTPWKDAAVSVARRLETGAGPALPLGLAVGT